MLAVPVPPTDEDDGTHLDGGARAWVVIFGATISMAATYGLMTGVGIFQVYWKENQLESYSTTDIAWITSIFGLLSILLAGPVGVLFDRWGARKLLFLSGAVYFSAFLGLAFSRKYEHFLGCFIVAGVSVGKFVSLPIFLCYDFGDSRQHRFTNIPTTSSLHHNHIDCGREPLVPQAKRPGHGHYNHGLWNWRHLLQHCPQAALGKVAMAGGYAGLERHSRCRRRRWGCLHQDEGIAENRLVLRFFVFQVAEVPLDDPHCFRYVSHGCPAGVRSPPLDCLAVR